MVPPDFPIGSIKRSRLDRSPGWQGDLTPSHPLLADSGILVDLFPAHSCEGSVGLSPIFPFFQP